MDWTSSCITRFKDLHASACGLHLLRLDSPYSTTHPLWGSCKNDWDVSFRGCPLKRKAFLPHPEKAQKPVAVRVAFSVLLKRCIRCSYANPSVLFNVQNSAKKRSICQISLNGCEEIILPDQPTAGTRIAAKRPADLQTNQVEPVAVVTARQRHGEAPLTCVCYHSGRIPSPEIRCASPFWR